MIAMPERQVEPPHLRLQPRPAGHRRDQPAAEPRPHLGAHQPVQQRVQQAFGRTTAARRRRASTRSPARGEQRLPPRLLRARPGPARGRGSPPARAAPRSGWSAGPSACRRPGARRRGHKRSRCRCWAGRTARRCARSCARAAGRTDTPRPAGAAAAPARRRRGSSTGWSGAAASPPWARRRCPRCRSGRRAPSGGMSAASAAMSSGGAVSAISCGPGSRRGGRRGLRRAVHDHQQVQRRRPAPRPAAAGRRTGRRTRWRRARPLVAQDMGVVVDGVGRVGRHRHGADRHQRGLGDRIFRPVLGDDQHPVAGATPGRAQARARREAAWRANVPQVVPCQAPPRWTRSIGRRATPGHARTSSPRGSARSDRSARFPDAAGCPLPASLQAYMQHGQSDPSKAPSPSP